MRLGPLVGSWMAATVAAGSSVLPGLRGERLDGVKAAIEERSGAFVLVVVHDVSS